jgi:hypothetical protein
MSGWAAHSPAVASSRRGSRRCVAPWRSSRTTPTHQAPARWQLGDGAGRNRRTAHGVGVQPRSRIRTSSCRCSKRWSWQPRAAETSARRAIELGRCMSAPGPCSSSARTRRLGYVHYLRGHAPPTPSSAAAGPCQRRSRAARALIELHRTQRRASRTREATEAQRFGDLAIRRTRGVAGSGRCGDALPSPRCTARRRRARRASRPAARPPAAVHALAVAENIDFDAIRNRLVVGGS